MFLFVIIAKLFLIARAAARVAFVVFSHSILFSVHEAVQVISNLRLEVCDNSASARAVQCMPHLDQKAIRKLSQGRKQLLFS